LPRSKKCRIDQLYDVGSHRHIAADDLPGVGNRRVGPLQARQYLLKRLRRARQRVDTADQLRKPVAAQQIAQSIRLRNRRLEGPALAGLGEILVRRADRTHDRTSFRMT